MLLQLQMILGTIQLRQRECVMLLLYLKFWNYYAFIIINNYGYLISVLVDDLFIRQNFESHFLFLSFLDTAVWMYN